jgi:hypothetical protein
MDPNDGTAVDPTSLHRYLYANNDPVRLSDPSGRVSGAFVLTAGLTVLVSAIAYPIARALLNPFIVTVNFEWRNTFRMFFLGGIPAREFSAHEVETIKLTALFRLKEAYQGTNIVFSAGGGTNHIEVKDRTLNGTAGSTIGGRAIRSEVSYQYAVEQARDFLHLTTKHSDAWAEATGMALGGIAAHELGHQLGVPYMDQHSDRNAWDYYEASDEMMFGTPRWIKQNYEYLQRHHAVR